jgi:hypothetical protein
MFCLDHLGLSSPEKPPPDVREVVRVPVVGHLDRAALLAPLSPENRRSDAFQLRPVEREADRALDLVDPPRLEGADT